MIIGLLSQKNKKNYYFMFLLVTLFWFFSVRLMSQSFGYNFTLKSVYSANPFSRHPRVKVAFVSVHVRREVHKDRDVVGFFVEPNIY